MDECRSRGRKFAERYLQTAVVVDDEAYMTADQSAGPNGPIVEPGRSAPAASQEDQNPVGGGSKHTLNAEPIAKSFSKLGVICAVIGPTPSLIDVMRPADIVVLDWLLRDNSDEYALELLCNFLDEKENRKWRNSHSLRLVAIYTGDAQLEHICEKILNRLKEIELDSVKQESEVEISYRHGRVVLYAKSRVVLYAKSDVQLAESLKKRSVAGADLPERLVDDFSAMTEGLLPSIALTSLIAVREGSHMILDRFCAKLDPAFLAHRTCISNRDDAERQIVNHVSEELRGLMDNIVAAESPAGSDAVKDWIRRKGKIRTDFKFGEKKLNLEQTIALATEDLKEELKKSELTKSDLKYLSSGFADSGAVGHDMERDKELAWIMSFRTVFDAPSPTLWLGSVVTMTEDGDEKHLICMKPRCDCVRLVEKTSFFFLPLVEPQKGEPQKEEEQLVVRLGEEFKLLNIKLDLAGGVIRQFNPSKDTVTATRQEPDGDFEFKDAVGNRYTWQGELRAEYAQRIARTLGNTLDRVAVDESELLRRRLIREP